MDHYATCKGWSTGLDNDCDCAHHRMVWRISMYAGRWEICRFLDGKWVHFLFAPDLAAAHKLVASLHWLGSPGGLRVVR